MFDYSTNYQTKIALLQDDNLYRPDTVQSEVISHTKSQHSLKL